MLDGCNGELRGGVFGVLLDVLVLRQQLPQIKLVGVLSDALQDALLALFLRLH